MARAKQSRRLARFWAERLGAASGIADAEDFLAGRGNPSAPPNRLEIQRAVYDMKWCLNAYQASNAKVDRCPTGYEDHYHDAYDFAARARCEEALS